MFQCRLQDCASHLIGAGATSADPGDAGEILDGAARRAYQGRIAEIATELAEAESWNDVGRTAALTEEAGQIRQALAEAIGLGGRSRRSGQAAERARVNVQRRITDALRRIGNIAPSLGRHLAISIRTGMSCSYRPESPHSLRRGPAGRVRTPRRVPLDVSCPARGRDWRRRTAVVAVDVAERPSKVPSGWPCSA